MKDRAVSVSDLSNLLAGKTIQGVSYGESGELNFDFTDGVVLSVRFVYGPDGEDIIARIISE